MKIEMNWLRKKVKQTRDNKKWTFWRVTNRKIWAVTGKSIAFL